MCIETEEQKLHRRIDRELRRQKKELRCVKILLLGTGESGKSTFMKQLRIIHDNGLERPELESQRVYVFHNTVHCMQQLLWAMKYFQLEFEVQTNHEYAAKLLNTSVTYANARELFPESCLPPEIVNCIECLWRDKGIRACFAKRNQFQLSDSAEYFFDNVHRYGAKGYIPDYADVVRIRVPTTGVSEHILNINKAKLRIVDVGGQDMERIKWIHCFENVKSIIFLTALNEYDMCKFKCSHRSGCDEIEQFFADNQVERVNRMQESLALFQVISSLELLADSSFILFFNKTDLFQSKLSDSPLSATFAKYTGSDSDWREAGQYIKNLFHSQAFSLWNSLNRQSFASKADNRNRLLYDHFTCATDTENIKVVFESVKHKILSDTVSEVLF